jgi:hypothetical protein
MSISVERAGADFFIVRDEGARRGKMRSDNVPRPWRAHCWRFKSLAADSFLSADCVHDGFGATSYFLCPILVQILAPRQRVDL